MGSEHAVGFAGLRVTLVGPLPPPAGGMANQTRQLAELLRSDRSEVTLVQTNVPFPRWVERLPGLRALVRLVPYMIALWRAAARCDVFHVMANSGWSWHLFAAPAIWIAHWRSVPVVLNYRGGEAAEFLRRAHHLVAWSMRRVAALVVPSGFLREIFAQYGMTSHVVPNIIDLSRFCPKPKSDATRAPHLMVARNLEPIYDNETALRAFAIVSERYPQARLTVAGTGPSQAELRALAKRLGIDQAVHFAGRLDRDAMADLYRDADVSINPSLVDNMPNSVLESLACAVPVVSTRVGGVPYIVQDGVSALLVPPQDPDAMAQALLRVLGDDSLRARLVDSGLAEVRRYEWSSVAPVLGLVYRNVQQCRPAKGQS